MADEVHVGVAVDDPRNAGGLALFRPEELTREELTARIEKIAARVENATTRAQMLERAANITEEAFRPPPPMCRKPGEFERKDLAYAAHPDLVVALRDAGKALPQDCLCLLWGRPALVHPQTGVIFAVAVGSIGIGARLPADYPGDKLTRRGDFDFAAAGPEWRLVDLRDNAGTPDAYVKAYGYAG